MYFPMKTHSGTTLFAKMHTADRHITSTNLDFTCLSLFQGNLQLVYCSLAGSLRTT